MNTNKISVAMLAVAASFGCAHQAPASSATKPSAPQSMFVTAPVAVAQPTPIVANEPKRDGVSVKLNLYQAVDDLEKYLASNEMPNQDAINDLVKTASRSFNAAKDLIDQDERDRFVDKIGALTQGLRLKYAEFMIEKLRYFNHVPETTEPTAEDVISDAKAALQMASDAGADVGMLEKQLPSLSQRAAANQAKKTAQH